MPEFEPIQLGIFLRVPVVGAVKTRLATSLDPESIHHLYTAFIQDTVAMARRCKGVQVVAWVAGDPEDPRLDPLLGDLPRMAQPQGDLGERMAVALGHGIEACGTCALIGTDSPALTPDHILQTRALLSDHRVALGPSADGGYYLVGARGEVPPMFQGIPWSSPDTLACTKERLKKAAISHALLPHSYDVDDATGLRLLRLHLSMQPERAPHTAKILSMLPRDR